MQELVWIILSALLVYAVLRIEKIIKILNSIKSDKQNTETAEDHPIIKAAKERMEKEEEKE